MVLYGPVATLTEVRVYIRYIGPSTWQLSIFRFEVKFILNEMRLIKIQTFIYSPKADIYRAWSYCFHFNAQGYALSTHKLVQTFRFQDINIIIIGWRTNRAQCLLPNKSKKLQIHLKDCD